MNCAVLRPDVELVWVLDLDERHGWDVYDDGDITPFDPTDAHLQADIERIERQDAAMAAFFGLDP